VTAAIQSGRPHPPVRTTAIRSPGKGCLRTAATPAAPEGFDEASEGVRDDDHCGADVIVVDKHELADERQHPVEAGDDWFADRQPARDRPRRFGADRAAAVDAQSHRPRAARADASDARLRRVLLHPPRDSANQRAVADLDHDRVERPGAQQLDADRSVPLGDRRRLAVGDEPLIEALETTDEVVRAAALEAPDRADVLQLEKAERSRAFR
jgi:hypothetical protein